MLSGIRKKMNDGGRKQLREKVIQKHFIAIILTTGFLYLNCLLLLITLGTQKKKLCVKHQ